MNRRLTRVCSLSLCGVLALAPLGGMGQQRLPVGGNDDVDAGTPYPPSPTNQPPANQRQPGRSPEQEDGGGGGGGSSALPAILVGVAALIAINQLLSKETGQPPETPDEEGRTARDRLDTFSDGGPDFPALFNMSAFVVRGPVKGGWPLVVDYEQTRAGRIEIQVSARGAANIYRFPLPPLGAGRHLVRFTLPEALGPELRPAVVAVSAMGGAAESGTLADFNVYGLGAGPEAVGSVAIDQLGFGPRSIRVSQEEAARYRFFSHSDFDTVSIEFLGLERAADGSRHRFVGRRFLAEGVRSEQWVGLDEPRVWDGRDDQDLVSVGNHRLQVRAWDRDGDWVCAWSPDSVVVSE